MFPARSILKNMLAGATGIDVALLIIAATKHHAQRRSTCMSDLSACGAASRPHKRDSWMTNGWRSSAPRW